MSYVNYMYDLHLCHCFPASDIINCSLFATGIYPHEALQYHTRSMARRDISIKVLCVDKFRDPTAIQRVWRDWRNARMLRTCLTKSSTVYPKKYAHGFVVLCFVVFMQSFIMNSYGVFIHIHQGCFAGTGAIVRLPQCQWSKPDGYGKISQCITTTKHSKAKTECIFLGIYCMFIRIWVE